MLFLDADLCGLHITATIATPEAVRTGLALIRLVNAARCSSGMAAIISTRRGCDFNLRRAETRDLI